MSASYAGKGGRVLLPGTPQVPVGSIREWQATIDRENYDSTALGDDYKQFVIGLGGWSGRIMANFYMPNDAAQTSVFHALTGGTVLVVQMETVNGFLIGGVIHVTQAVITNAVAALVTAEFTYVGTGSPSVS